MAISYVNEAEYKTTTASPNTEVRATIPTGIQTGDLLLCAFGNVSNQLAAASMNNSWTKLEEAGIAGDNCYFILAAKIATSTEVSAAGTSVQIATMNDSAGNTNKTSQTLAYRGVKSTVGTAVVASNMTHETSPADETISTNTATATASTQWGVFFFNMAAGSANGDQSAGTFSGSSMTFRGHSQSYYSTGGTNSACAGADSNGTISAGSVSRNGTWSINSTRLNAAVVIIDAGQVDLSASAGSTGTISGTSNAPVGGVGAKAGGIG